MASPAPPKPGKKPPQEDTQIALNEETSSSEVQVASPAPPEQKPLQADNLLNEEMPSSEVQVASPTPPEQKPLQADTQIVVNEEMLSSQVQVASPAPPRPEKKPPQEHTQIALNEETPSSEVQVVDPAPPKPEKKPPTASAADEADVNAAKSPRRKTDNERLQPKIRTSATVNDKLLAASAAMKPLAHKEKPATRKTASRSRSKPPLFETPTRPFSVGTSPRMASAAYAASVYGALARNKPRSVGANGSVTVSFAIGASGSLQNVLVARSSGKASVDHAALATIRQAAPFSPPPGSRQSYTITISFR